MESKIFDHILQDNEKIIWTNGVNKKAYMIKSTLKGAMYTVFIAIFFGSFVSIPFVAFNDDISSKEVFGVRILIWLIAFIIGVIICYVTARLNANNTFFAITNKRIILRNGAFNNVYTHYSLKNIGNIQVSGNIFDSKGNEASANLIITTKDFHTNTDGNKNPKLLTIISLKGAYEAYKIITEKTEGNNEAFRIKNVD